MALAASESRMRGRFPVRQRGDPRVVLALFSARPSRVRTHAEAPSGEVMMRSSSLGSILLLTLLSIAACDKPPPKPEKKAAAPTKVAEPPGFTIDKALLTGFEPLPEVMESKSNPITEEKIALGRMLYYETRLSKNHETSCNTCHDLAKSGVDGTPTSVGHKGQKGDRNSPTVYDAALQFVQFWDGRAADVEDQARMPILNPVEMAMPDEAYVLKLLNSIPQYVEAFKKAFPDDETTVSYVNLGKAIGAFERKLVTPSKWDTFLKGDTKALTDDEKKGFTKFVQVGCTQCHTGPLVGGTMYQKLGKEKPWPSQTDKGRARVTKSASDEMMFKVPSLREVAGTAPYFHDGSETSLTNAVKMMASYQLKKELTDEEATSIVTWLGTLSGTVPTDFIAKPELPPSTPATPKPDPS
jgi:cytochrome c peroxidase